MTVTAPSSVIYIPKAVQLQHPCLLSACATRGNPLGALVNQRFAGQLPAMEAPPPEGLGPDSDDDYIGWTDPKDKGLGDGEQAAPVPQLPEDRRNDVERAAVLLLAAEDELSYLAYRIKDIRLHSLERRMAARRNYVASVLEVWSLSLLLRRFSSELCACQQRCSRKSVTL